MKIERAANGMLTYVSKEGKAVNNVYDLPKEEQPAALALLAKRRWQRELRELQTAPYLADFAKGRRKS